MKTKKPTQEQVAAEFIREAGFITTRQAAQLNINNPYEIIRQVKKDVQMSEMKIQTKTGAYIKVHYTSKRAALGYVKFIGGSVI